jgi:hypothetical protein
METKREHKKLQRRLDKAEMDADQADADRDQAEETLKGVREQLNAEHEYADRLEAEMAEEDARMEEEEKEKARGGGEDMGEGLANGANGDTLSKTDGTFSIDEEEKVEAAAADAGGARRNSGTMPNPLFSILNEANSEDPIAFSDQHAAFRGNAASPPRAPRGGITAGLTRMVRGLTPSPSPIRRKSRQGASSYNIFDSSPDPKQTGDGSHSAPHQAIV